MSRAFLPHELRPASRDIQVQLTASPVTTTCCLHDARPPNGQAGVSKRLAHPFPTELLGPCNASAAEFGRTAIVHARSKLPPSPAPNNTRPQRRVGLAFPHMRHPPPELRQQPLRGPGPHPRPSGAERIRGCRRRGSGHGLRRVLSVGAQSTPLLAARSRIALAVNASRRKWCAPQRVVRAWTQCGGAGSH